MYLTTLDIFAVIIALVMCITFVITTGIANAKLTASVKYWREAHHNYKFATEAEAMGKPYSWNPDSNSWEYK